MGRTSKVFTLLIVVILAVSSLIMVESASAQSTPKPSVPEFTVQYIKTSYSVIDPYTGVSQKVDNSTIEVKIKNHPFTYTNNGTSYHLYYGVRTKPHFEGNWTERYPIIDRANSPYNTVSKSFASSKYLTDEFHPSLPVDSNADYTVVFYALNGENAYYQFTGLPPNAQIDFEVEAIVGHDSQAWYVQHPLYPEYGGFYEPAVAYDTDSGWSNTQTINLTDGSVSVSASPNPTPSPTNTLASPTPTVPELPPWIIPILLIIMGALAGLLVYHKKQKQIETNTLEFK